MSAFWLKEQKKKSKERRDRWIKKTKKSKSVWGTYAGTKTAERSIFCARRCKYKTWPLLQTRQSQSSSLQPTAHPAHCLSVCLSSLHCICIFNICICMNQDSLTSLPDLHFHYWRAKTSREESHLATLTEQLMCRAGSSQICRFCTLFETQHLAVSPPSIIPNTSHPASPLLCCIISSSPLLVHTRPRSVSCQWNDLFNT